MPMSQDTDQHPLFNDLILRNLFSKLNFQEILTCRLVCKAWSTNSNILQSLSEDTLISFNKEIEKLTRYTEETKHLQQQQQKSLPFKRYSLHYVPVDKHLQEFREFVKVCGPSIHYIKLNLDSSQMDISTFRNLIWYQTPNLHTLYIYNLSHDYVYSEKLLAKHIRPKNFQLRGKLKCLIMQEIRLPIVQFMRDLFEVDKKIESITMLSDIRSDWDDQAGIHKRHSSLATSIFNGLLETRNYKYLKYINCGVLDLSHIETLIEIGKSGYLRLQELEMYSLDEDVPPETFKEFLQSQSNSLNILRILGNIQKLKRFVGFIHINQNSHYNHNRDYEMAALEFPKCMKAIRVLQFSGRVKDTPVPIQPINYFNQFPNLHTLIVNGYSYNMQIKNYFSDKITCPCITLKKLVLPSAIRDSSLPFTLKKLFPNVIDLELQSPENEFLLGIWKSFDKLERLKISCFSENNIDAGLTGINEELCQILVNRSYSEFGDSDLDTCNYKSHIERLGIHSLKYLRRLEIMVETKHKEVPKSLSSVTAFFSLKHMTWLRYLLVISTCWYHGPIPCNYFTLKCQEDLKNCLDLKHTAILFTPASSDECC